VTTTTQKPELQPLSPEKLSEIVRIFRDMRKWSQETLADLSGLNTRTVQRIENSEPSSAETRRALARGFEMDDIDIFNKPHKVYSEEDLAAERKRIQDKYLSLEATTITTGRQLGELVAQMTMDCVTQDVELTVDAATDFAQLIDFMRDYRDCADMYSEVGKLEIYADFQGHIDTLGKLGISLCCAIRKTALTGEAWANKTPLPVTILYLTAFKKGDERTLFIVEKRVNFQV
jgi:transcriptional regulator with XRE-family HTH domain